jgi:hypothetical protein
MRPIVAILVAFAYALEADPQLAGGFARVLGGARPAEERIPLAEVTEHGAPSPQWVQARSRRDQSEIRKPRGPSFLRAADLRALLAATTVARRLKPSPTTSLADDAKSAVVDLAARRTSAEPQKGERPRTGWQAKTRTFATEMKMSLAQEEGRASRSGAQLWATRRSA